MSIFSFQTRGQGEFIFNRVLKAFKENWISHYLFVDILNRSRPISDMMIFIIKSKCKSVDETEKGPIKNDVIKILYTLYFISILITEVAFIVLVFCKTLKNRNICYFFTNMKVVINL